MELNAAVRHVCRNSASLVGPRFFPAMAKDLCELLGCDFALVGELVDSRDAIETLAVCAGGAARENIRYALKDSPCEDVVGKDPAVHCDRVAQLYPDDPLLEEMQVRGYIGVPIYSTDNLPSGILVALFKEPIGNDDSALSLMTLFAARTGAELDRLRAVRRADELETQALQSQKLESLGVLAGGLAHDFNNVLSTILGSTDLTRLELPQEHAALEHLVTIQEAAATAAGLCRQLLAYAGKGRFRVEDADISEVVRSQDRLLQASVSSNVTLQLQLSTTAAVARLDRSQIGQILLNLVINASEAIGETKLAGLVRVTTGFMDCDRAYLQSTHLNEQVGPGRYIFLEVSDDGPGMNETVLAKLFDPFFTTKFTGRGLGLAAILGIAKSHSGTVKVYTEVGKGSSIKVLFPASDCPPKSVANEQTTKAWRGRGTVLLVDDNESIRSVGSKMLTAIGFSPVTAEDGVAAMEIVRADPQQFDLVILDLTMPRMGGEETYRALKSLLPELPVILTSGFNEQDTVQSFLGKRLAGFLQKPFRLQDLRAATERALEASEGSAVSSADL